MKAYQRKWLAAAAAAAAGIGLQPQHGRRRNGNWRKLAWPASKLLTSSSSASYGGNGAGSGSRSGRLKACIMAAGAKPMAGISAKAIIGWRQYSGMA